MNDAAMQEIRERNERALANRRSWDDGFASTDEDVRDLLREVARLRGQVATLKAALEPFTLCVGMFASCSDDWLYRDAPEEYGDNASPITVGHCRRAKAVLESEQKECK